MMLKLVLSMFIESIDGLSSIDLVVSKCILFGFCNMIVQKIDYESEEERRGEMNQSPFKGLPTSFFFLINHSPSLVSMDTDTGYRHNMIRIWRYKKIGIKEEDTSGVHIYDKRSIGTRYGHDTDTTTI